MWSSTQWEDYEVLDASDGEKLERWGKYTLIRPDPQVIWTTPKSAAWKKVNAHYFRSDKGGGKWEFYDLPNEWTIRYRDHHFALKPFSFKHTGLFPEQAVNWDWFSPIIAEAVKSGREVSVLNLFAYTGGATIAAASSGAKVTHVDASKGMVQWAKENALLSRIPEDRIRWLVDDCVKFVEREIRRGHTYDAIILDPPSYGRGPKGEIWKLESSIAPFLALLSQLLSDRPLFVLLNMYTTGLQPGVLSYLLHTAFDSAVPGLEAEVTADEIGLPVTQTGLLLPCGCAGRWVPKHPQA